jgi:hypothetical protein
MADASRNGSTHQDCARISLTQEDEVRYWTRLFGVSKNRLMALVGKVGFSPEAVAREVGKAALNSER